MHVDTLLDPVAAPSVAAEFERAGFGCAWVTETVRDPFIVLALAAQETRTIELGTGVAIGFARSPMTPAQSAHDVQRLSGGRLRVALATPKRIAFYASTPAYRFVLEVHGWGGLHDRLHALSKEGRWEDMAALIDDEVLDAFAVVAEPDDVAAALRKRWDGLADRLTVHCAADPGAEVWPAIAAGMGAP